MFEIKKININLQNLIIFSSLSIVLIAWLGSLLAVLGAFKLLIPILIIIAIFLCVLVLKTKLILSISRNEIILVFSVILLAIANGYFYHETIDHGRDPGAYISSAINIAKTGNFEVNEEYIYTYRGYRLTPSEKLMPYPPIPAYSSILAFMYQLFGIYGIFWSNAMFFLFFLLIMYLIGVEFGNRKIGLVFIVLFSTHYLTIWFTRRTNNETFFMLLLWLAVYLFLKGYISKEKYHFYLSLIPLSIIPLVRMEGILYYMVFLLVLLFLLLREKIGVKNILQVCFVLLILSIPLYASDFTRQTVFKLIQESIPVLKSQSQQILAPTIEQTGYFWEVYEQNMYRFTIDMFSYYLLTPLAIIFIMYLLKHHNNFTFILLLTLISPAIYFLINPANSPDQPWFMRRFWPHIVVLLFFVPAIILGNMKLAYNRNKFIFCVVLLFLLFNNLIYSNKIITFSEDRGLLEQLSILDKKLPAKVYIFGIEGKENYWFLIPMHFLYNRPVINNKIEQENWRRITIEELARFIPENEEVIIISPRNDLPKNWFVIYFNDFDLKYVDNFTIKVPRISLTADLLGYQTPVPSAIQEGKTKITYEWIEEKSKGTPPTNISVNTYNLFIFKVYKENNKLELFRKNISLMEGWKRNEDYLICVADECSFKSLIWNNSIILNVSYPENSNNNFTLYYNTSKSKVNLSLRNSSLSVAIYPEMTENRFVVSKGALIKDISARYIKDGNEQIREQKETR